MPDNSNPIDKVHLPQIPDMTVLGRSGLDAWSGHILEEWHKDLRGPLKNKKFKEMEDNEPSIVALLYMMRMFTRGTEWTVVDPKGPEGELGESGEFISQCMEDMTHTWDDFIDEGLSMYTFGWAFHEILWKLRRGLEVDDFNLYSKYNDGKIGWRALPLRGQETLDRWEFVDEYILGWYQTGGLFAGFANEVFLPSYKGVHFRTTKYKNNPEGRSLLRGAYRPYYFKQHIEMFEAIGIERDLAGYPVLQVPADIMQPNAPPEYKELLATLETAIQEVKRDEREGLIIPNEADGYSFTLLRSAGARQFDTGEVIERKTKEILIASLADFIIMGHEQVGSFALSASKIGVFTNALNASLEMMQQVINSQLVEPTLILNNMLQEEDNPEIIVGKVSLRDVETKIEGLAKLAGANLLPFDAPIEVVNTVLRELDLPEIEEKDFTRPPPLVLPTGLPAGGAGL